MTTINKSFDVITDQYVISDLLDICIEECPDTLNLDHPCIRHNLTVNHLWKIQYGVPMSKVEIREFNGGRIKSSARVDRQALMDYVTGTRRLPQCAMPNVRDFENDLETRVCLYREIIRKLYERHNAYSWSEETFEFDDDVYSYTITDVYKRILHNRTRYFEKCMTQIKEKQLLIINPVTQHCMATPEHWDWTSLQPCISYLDAIRSVCIRDFMFVTQSSNSMCIFVESDAIDSVRPDVIDVLIDEAASNSNFPITIMSPDNLFLREKRDFFFFANLVSEEEYSCIPNKFKGFILIGRKRIPDRIPLTANASRCFYYCVDCIDNTKNEYVGNLTNCFEDCEIRRHKSDEKNGENCANGENRTSYDKNGNENIRKTEFDEELDTKKAIISPSGHIHRSLSTTLRFMTAYDASQSYVMVCDTIHDCSETQKLTRNIVYIAPQFSPFIHVEEKLKIGFHPESAYLAPLAPTVLPDDAYTCEIYVNLKNDEGALECASNGGCAVLNKRPDGFFNGYNFIISNDMSFNDDIANTDIYKIGENAKKSLQLVNSEKVFRWIWKGILTNPCPIKANTPAYGVLLNTRFLVMYVIAKLKNAISYEVDTNSKNTLLVVDNRKDVATVYSALVSMTNLPPKWNVVVFCTVENEEFMRNSLPMACIKLIDNYPSKSFFIEEYNRLMKTEAFWSAVPGEKCLLVQNDGTLVRPGIEKHESFKYDLAGAPWRSHPYLHEATSGNLVGNGGMTVRSPKVCKEICKIFKHERLHVYDTCTLISEAEDVFFARRIPRENVCPYALAKEFSMEQVANIKALGYHRFWVYHPVSLTVEFFEIALKEALERISP